MLAAVLKIESLSEPPLIETLEPSEFKIESFLLPYFPTTLIPQRQRVGILIDAANVDDIFQMQMRPR